MQREIDPRIEAMIAYLDMFRRVFDLSLRTGGITHLLADGRRATGGLLLLMDPPGVEPPSRMLHSIGREPIEPDAKEHVREKTERNRRSGHVSSWVDRNVALKQYGGSISLDVGDFLAGFSGTGQEHEEAALLTAGVLLRHASDERVKQILDASHNQKFIPLLTACQREFAAT